MSDGLMSSSRRTSSLLLCRCAVRQVDISKARSFGQSALGRRCPSSARFGSESFGAPFRNYEPVILERWRRSNGIGSLDLCRY